jgi:hypothetical protein
MSKIKDNAVNNSLDLEDKLPQQKPPPIKIMSSTVASTKKANVIKPPDFSNITNVHNNIFFKESRRHKSRFLQYSQYPHK